MVRTRGNNPLQAFWYPHKMYFTQLVDQKSMHNFRQNWLFLLKYAKMDPSDPKFQITLLILLLSERGCIRDDVDCAKGTIHGKGESDLQIQNWTEICGGEEPVVQNSTS